MAAKGWVVFSPNYRGSDNLGNAYQRAIFNDAGDGPGRDVMAGLEEVKKRGFVDTARIGVSGWSYGGYMTSWLTGHFPGWKAAVAGAAVNDLVEEYALSDFNVTNRASFAGLLVAVRRRCDQALPGAVADHLRSGDQDADADPVRHGRRAGADHPVLPDVPCA